MWTYDLNKEEWSLISFQSSVVPLPRSELGHVRYQDDLYYLEVKDTLSYS